MNQSNVKDFLPILQAWSEGKVLQYRPNESCKWEDCSPATELEFSSPISCYRINPEAKECWLIYNSRGYYTTLVHEEHTKDYENRFGWTIHHMKEQV